MGIEKDLQSAYEDGFSRGQQEADMRIKSLQKRLRMALKNLKAIDTGCQFCAHSGEYPLDCDGECSKCNRDCSCAGCSNNSKWRWLWTRKKF